MKLFKRLAAMAMMAALCITMAAPMSADAALSTCKHDLKVKEISREYVKSETVMFHYMMDVDGDGYEESVTDSCTEVTFSVKYAIQCIHCGFALESTEIEEKEVQYEKKHSNSGIDNVDLPM